MKRLLIILGILIVCGGVLLFWEMRKNGEEKDEIITSETAIEWTNESFETMVREMLKKPQGAIYVKDVERIETLYIVGEEVVDTEWPDEFFQYENSGMIDEERFREPQDYEDIKYFRGLKSIIFCGTYIKSYDFLTKMQQLYMISFSFCRLPDEELPEISLSEIYYRGIESVDVRKLENLSGLQTFSATDTVVESLAELQSIKSLKKVAVDNCGISDISWAIACEGLEELSLVGNDIASVAGIERLEKLWALMLAKNPIEDITPLLKMTWLEALGISKAVVEDWSVFETLPNCHVYDGYEEEGWTVD